MEPTTDENVLRARAAWDLLRQAGGLGGPVELAAHWGLDPGFVKQVVRRSDFPRPAGRVGGRALWLLAEADAWRARQLDRGGA